MAINRREFLEGVAASAALGQIARGQPAGKPNILHIMVDQVQWGAIAGRSACNTPNINRLASQGILFERSYTPSALCCPARSILCSGAFPWHNGVYNQVHVAPSLSHDMFPDVVTYSQCLKEAGYRQGYVGKWHASYVRTPLDFGYDEIAAPMAYNPELLRKASKSTISQWLRRLDPFSGYVEPRTGINTNPDGVPEPRLNKSANAQVERWFTWPGSEKFSMWGYIDGPEEETEPYWVAESGIRMMKRFAAASKPWALEMQFVWPHDPYIAVKKYVDRYHPADIPVPESFHDPFEGKPLLHQRESETWGAITEDDYRISRARYYACCEQVDAQVGRILEALDQTGQAENTIVVFCTDHGDLVGAHRMWIKGWMPYEECYRIPMVIRWPARIRPGLVSHRLVQLHDLAHTYVEAAGANPLPYPDGQSLLPLFENPNRPDWRDQILCTYYGCELIYMQRYAITERHKYVFNAFSIDECYDLENDPQEMHNLINDGNSADVVGDMRARLYELMSQFGDPYGSVGPVPDVDPAGREFRAAYRWYAPRYLPSGKRMGGKA